MRSYSGIVLLSVVLAGCGSVPERSIPERVHRPVSGSPVATMRPEARQCHAELGQTGSSFAPLPDQFYGAGCSVLNSVKLDRVGGDRGEFEVTNLGPLSCPLANTFAAWARYGVDRAARQILGSPLARIETMGSYACRNVSGTGRLSAHARAEAVDISAFILKNGQRVSVLSGWNASHEEREFLRTIHRSACKRFGTVLGPNYNSAHVNHFHLELGSGSFCR